MNIKHKFISLFFSESSKSDCDEILTKWSKYYSGLSPQLQRTFVIRTLIFLETTTFSAKEGFELTREMKLVICSAFVQITFGLRQDTLDIFKHIFVSPTSYSYRQGGPLFDGDVNPMAKRVNLSWPAVENGFVIDDDGINLAIHEFGHCLIIENARRSYLMRIFNERKLKQWKVLAAEMIPAIRNGDSKLFRGYGGRNLMELFSVCLETFFERPVEFYSYSSRFYKSMSVVLKQDPRNTKDPKDLSRL